MTPVVHSYYRSNIAPEMLKAQADVFEHFGVPLKQWKDDSRNHGEWITHVMREAKPDEVVMIADIDAFPLSFEAYNDMASKAQQGALAGLAQVANHIDKSKLYAGPMFMAVSSNMYREFGSPELIKNKVVDVAQILTNMAVVSNIPVQMVFPKFAIHPKWGLADQGIFGVGTFYGDDEFFHLFEARRSEAISLFVEVSKGVIKGSHDYARYVEILSQTPKKKRFKLF
ncbi:hypothetical protein Q4544_14615 [Cognatishimia sp. 1_MG-2023]|uniref:hypothetical protein n=1 Tax=Cognatishimia sp. 1_MG-2023 TaxID=3062642 RepID=UPI0026E33C53|nr:hypothetical protein [Cognatishimia sp. 1_MG-2023]MDO6728169.1 hypothetical protein [Cognatishimia sp. 1_MG-2023]